MPRYEIFTPEIPEPEDNPILTQPENIQEENKEKPKSKGGARNSKPRQTKAVSKPKEKPTTPQISFTERIKQWVMSPQLRIVIGIFLGCLSIYLLVSFISYFGDCIQDQSIINSAPIGESEKVGNAGGEGGARLSEFLINEGFGLGSFVIIIWLIGMTLKLLVGQPKFKSVDFTIKCMVALITVSLIVGLATIAVSTSVNWGGYHGRYVNEFIIHFVGWTGAGLLCIFLVALFVVICLRDLVNWIMKLKYKRDEKRKIAAEIKAAELEREQELLRMQRQQHEEDIKSGEATDNRSEKDTEANLTGVSFQNEEMPLYTLETVTESEGPTNYSDTAEIEGVDTEGEEAAGPEWIKDKAEEETVEASDINMELKEETKEENSDAEKTDEKMVVTVNTIGQSDKQHYSSQLDFESSHKYKFPPFDLLKPGVEKISIDEEEQLENEARIKKTLLDFGIPIVSIKATVGPTVTLYEIVPDTGVKIARIRGLVDDIALSLAATGIRIIAPIPGKGTVGIEVANKDKLTVAMRTIIQSNKFQTSKYELPIALGSTISNDVYVANLAKMPHLLVAGATGQGKSVGLNAIIASLLYSKSPSELKFVMIDPKQVEFSLYNKLRDYYMAMIPEELESSDGEPVITDMKKVEATLNSLCIEMEQRYTLLKNAHVRNLEEYNAKVKEGTLSSLEGHHFLPYIVVIVDEFGDLVMVSGKAVETPIARLAQKARAVGMHVIIATQRPSTNVITGIIKANFPARISFKVSSGVDSKTILDTTGAQQLIGRGDMLIFNSSEMVRVQCAFIDTPEVENIVNYIEKQPYAPGPYVLPEPVMGEEGEASDPGEIGARDSLFEEAARAVVQAGMASTSWLQRRFSIGYTRAAKIMDQLEAAKIIGPQQGAKPRAILIDPMSIDDYLRAL